MTLSFIFLFSVNFLVCSWFLSASPPSSLRTLQDVIVSDFTVNSQSLQNDPKAQVSQYLYGFLVCWQSLRSGSTTTYEVLAQNMSTQGVPQGSVIKVDASSLTNQVSPNIVELRDGRLVIIWTGVNEVSGKSTVFGQIFDFELKKNGSRFSIDPSGVFSKWDQSDPNLGATEDGGFVVTWSNSSQVWLQIFFSNGTRCGNAVYVFEGEDAPPKPQVVGLNSGDIVIVSAFGDDLLGKLFSNDGLEVIQNDFGINTVSPVDSQYLQVTSDGFLVIYAGWNNDTKMKDIYGQYFNVEGKTIGDEVIMHNATKGNDSTTFITVLEDQCFIMTFDLISSANGSDVYYEKFDPNGLITTSETIVNTVTTGEQYGNNGGMFSNGNFVIIWNDYDTTTKVYNIRGKIYSHGNDPFRFVQNTLLIKQGQSKCIEDSEINTLGLGQITYTADLVANGYFSLISAKTTPIFSFTQDDIDNLRLYFTHLGSSSAPSYYLKSTNGSSTSDWVKVDVTFNLLPYFVVNSIEVEQNTSIVVTDSMIDGVAADDFVPIFIVWSNSSCYFANKKNPTVAIDSFTTDNISNLSIIFIADDTVNTPSYSLGIKDGDDFIENSTGKVIYYTALKVKNYSITISQGQWLYLTESMIDVDIDPKLTAKYMVGNVIAGYFVLTSDTENQVKSFTDEQVTKGQVIFIQDGSLTKPDIKLLVSDGFVTIEDVDIQVKFLPHYYLLTNKLVINKGQTINITFQFLNGSCSIPSSSPSEIIFKIDSLIHGKFIQNDQFADSFTMEDIYLSQITFVHDGSDQPPYYRASIGDGTLQTEPIAALISYNGQSPFPIFLKASLVVNQGETVCLTPDDLLASDGGINNDFVFEIYNIHNAIFAFSTNLSAPVTRFYQSNVSNSMICLIHDDSKISPSYELVVSTLGGLSNGIHSTTSIDFNSQPELLTNTLYIEKGEKKFLTSGDLSADDLESDPNDLIFYVTDVLYGQFENIDTPSDPINLFYQADINSRKIIFVHDNSENAPEYSVAVSDGSIKIEPSPAIIDFSVAKGMCGLKKIALAESEMMRGISVTSTTDYVIADLYAGHIVVININDPTNPKLLKNSTLDLSKKGITQLSESLIDSETNILYVLSDTHTLVSVSVENPKTPVLLGTVGSAKTVNDLTLCGNGFAYIAANQEGIHIVNITNSSNLIINKTLVIKSNYIVSSPDCFDDFLFLVTSETPPIKSKFMSFSIIDPVNPVFIAETNLSDTANYVKINKNRDKAFVATDSGVDFINLTNPKSPFLAANLTFANEVLSLDVSEDEIYISVITDLKLIMINVENLTNPVVLDTLLYEVGLNQPFFLPQSHYGFIGSTEGLLVYSIFRGQQSRMSPYLQSTGNYQQTSNNKHIASSPGGEYYFINTIYNGNQSLLIMDSSNNKLIKAVDLACQDMNSPGVAISKDGTMAFVTNCGNVTAIDINPVKAAGIINTCKVTNAWGVAVSADSKYLYVSSKAQKTVSILSNERDAGIALVSKVTMESVPTIIAPNRNDRYLHVLLDGKGLSIIDIANKENPKVIELPEEAANLGDARSLVYLSDIYGDEYVIVTLFYEGMIKVVNVQNASEAGVLAVRFIGKETSGIGLFKNKNFLAVQSVHSLTILEIRNISIPVDVADIDSDTIPEIYQIAVLDSIICLPSFETFQIYSGKTFFYPSLESHTNNLGEKLFYVQFFPVDPVTMDKTQEKCKLLTMGTQDSWPYWMTMDYSTNVLTIAPPAMDSLSMARKLTLVFGTQIPTTELASIGDIQEVIRALLFENYIDAFSIPTTQFNPDTPISLHLNTSLTSDNIAKIPGVLKKHLLTHYVTFTLQDFLTLDSEPEEGDVSLQDQFNDIGVPKLNQRIDFQFEDTTFYDSDGDSLHYSAYGMPSFLQFSDYNLKFFGTPTKDDLGVYSIMVQASDGYKSVTQNFTLPILNVPPDSNAADDQFLKLGNTFDYSFDPNVFIDADGDKLEYNAEILNNTSGEISELPDWLTLDSVRLRLFGTPDAFDIERDDENQRFYQVFTINMSAVDIADQMTFFLFNLTVQNYYPYRNSNRNLSSLFRAKFGDYIRINQQVDFDFANTFLDQEDTLTYTTEEPLPHWLSLTGTVFYGQPSKKDLGNSTITVWASDGYGNCSDSFTISVQNHAPKASNLNNYTLIFGHTLDYVVKSPFVDPDNDTLVYTAFLINKTTKTLESLPSWILFDKLSLIFSGSPNPEEIPFMPEDSGYYAEYPLSIMATDPGDLTALANFTLIVQNSPPYMNPKNSLAKQFKDLSVQVLVTSDKQFDDDTFIDPNNDTLSYDARLISLESKWFGRRLEVGETLPGWITFDDKTRKFTFSPDTDVLNNEVTIQLTAQNSKLSRSERFTFRVQISMTYAFQIFLSVIGAVGSFLGFLAYRKTIYAILGKKYYCYSEYEKIGVNQRFEKIIYLIKDDLETCGIIWRRVKKDNPDVTAIYESSNRHEVLKNAVFEATQKLIQEKIIDDSSELGSFRFAEIFQCFLILEASKNYPLINKIFEKVRKNLSLKKNKDWYTNLVVISSPTLSEDLVKLFPNVEVQEAFLMETVNKVQTNKERKYSDLSEKEKNLLQGRIKASVLGIPHPSARFDTFFEFTRGESIFQNWNEISEIQIFKNKSNADYVHTSMFDYPERNNFNSLTPWFGYKIEKDMLVFTGTPSNIDQGKYVVRIFNDEDVIVREFGIIVTDYTPKNRKSMSETFYNSVFSPLCTQPVSPMKGMGKFGQLVESPVKTEDKRMLRDEINEQENFMEIDEKL